jgi:hypothetical protein
LSLSIRRGWRGVSGERKSIFAVPLDEVEEARFDEAAEAEIDAGHGVLHSQVREWLAKRGRGEKVPPPWA